MPRFESISPRRICRFALIAIVLLLLTSAHGAPALRAESPAGPGRETASDEGPHSYLDIASPQEKAVHARAGAGEALAYRRVRADRDGRILILAGDSLYEATGERILPYVALRGVASRRHRDLGVSHGKFVFLTDEFLLPLHGAGRDWFDTRELDVSRVAEGRNGEWILLTPREVIFRRGTEIERFGQPGARDIAVNGSSDEVFLWGPSSALAGRHRGALQPIDLSGAVIRDVAARPGGGFFIASDRGLLIAGGDGTDLGVHPDPRPLPVRDLTAIELGGNGDDLWLGSTRGAFRLGSSGRIDYYAGRRWLLDDHVIDLALALAPSGERALEDVHILTPAGLSTLDFEPMTLADKAEVYETRLRRRHIRFGLVSDVVLVDGDPGRAELVDTDNDGLWSSLYLAAECFRWSVTRSDSALENVLDGLDAFERLVELPRIPGFQARSFEIAGFEVSDPDRWRTEPGELFAWKGHTSSDEIVGTMFFYSVLWETVGRERPRVRERVARVVSAVLDHILDHDLYLVDVDGKPTLWGRWNPEYVNTARVGGDRRLNSIEILSFLELGIRVTGSDRYRETFRRLVEEHGYAENTVNWLPDPLGPWNHSDDELYWLSYWNLVPLAFDPALRETFLQSAREHRAATVRKRNPLWTFIAGVVTGDPVDLDSAIAVLEDFPLDTRDWRLENSHRLDIRIVERPRVARETDPKLPPDERRAHKWNTNELTPDGGGDGRGEESGAEFLLPYWMGRHYGWISPPRG